MEAINLADLYQLPLLDWASIEAKLRSGVTQAPDTGGPKRHTCWLSTINADGSPHVNGVGALCADGCFWFETGQGSRKGRNLARDPRCAMSLATEEFDLVVEGEATVVTDPATVADMAARWATGGWPARVDDTGVALTAEFSAPSAGPPPWHVYRLRPKKAFAYARPTTVDTRHGVVRAWSRHPHRMQRTPAGTSSHGSVVETLRHHGLRRALGKSRARSKKVAAATRRVR